MHPEFACTLAEQHRADLARSAAASRRGRRSWPAAAQRWLGRVKPRRLPGGAARFPQPALPGEFLAGTDAYGFRIYLTPAEARRLARDCSRLVDRFADRVGDPGRRPAGAVPLELVLLGRRLPEPAGAGRGLPRGD